MALSPLDLQTLFVKMGEVAREQAHLKGAEAQEQAFEAKKLAEQERQKDSSVAKAAEESEMDNRIKDGEKGGAESGEGGSKREEPDEEKPEREYIRDSHLGQHIDLIG